MAQPVSDDRAVPGVGEGRHGPPARELRVREARTVDKAVDRRRDGQPDALVHEGSVCAGISDADTPQAVRAGATPAQCTYQGTRHEVGGVVVKAVALVASVSAGRK